VFIDVKNPTENQAKKALMIHCFVIEKRDGRIKARAVADGRGQQRYTEEETYSPTVKLESVFFNAFIDAHEGRHVVTIDIKGAFLKAKVPDNLELMVKMTGELAQIMCEIDSSLKVNDEGILYLKCVKALYGHIEAAQLFYDDLNEKIQKDMNFRQNQYDPCVYNKKVGENIMTIRIHVDNLKVSCKSKELLEEVVEQLRKAYGEITVHYGDEHDYLGMVLSYNTQQKTITLNMKKYVEEMLVQFGQENDDQIKIVKTPANNNLFQTRKTTESMVLTKHQSMQFHSNVAKMLFLAKRGRPDILLAVSFLST
jgi:hypothetical protein